MTIRPPDPTLRLAAIVEWSDDQTDHDQLLIGSLPSVEQAMSWRTNPDAALVADLASDSTTGPLIAGTTPDGGGRGTLKERYFFRRGAGSGRTLVGDAGHHKEFVIGDGITEALLQARSLAVAIGQGTDAALIRWWRARDVEALPFFFLGQDEGALGPPSELQQVVFAGAAKRPALRVRLAATMEHRLSPTETFPVRHVLWWALAAALRGAPRVLTVHREGQTWVSHRSGTASASTASRGGGGRRGTLDCQTSARGAEFRREPWNSRKRGLRSELEREYRCYASQPQAEPLRLCW
jgi:hypothetical protein